MRGNENWSSRSAFTTTFIHADWYDATRNRVMSLNYCKYTSVEYSRLTQRSNTVLIRNSSLTFSSKTRPARSDCVSSLCLQVRQDLLENKRGPLLVFLTFEKGVNERNDLIMSDHILSHSDWSLNYRRRFCYKRCRKNVTRSAASTQPGTKHKRERDSEIPFSTREYDEPDQLQLIRCM